MSVTLKEKKENLLPIPCHSTKPDSPKCILLGGTRLNGADVKKQACLDVASLVKRLPGDARSLTLQAKAREMSKY